jgi:hypothetical protein
MITLTGRYTKPVLNEHWFKEVLSPAAPQTLAL